MVLFEDSIIGSADNISISNKTQVLADLLKFNLRIGGRIETKNEEGNLLYFHQGLYPYANCNLVLDVANGYVSLDEATKNKENQQNTISITEEDLRQIESRIENTLPSYDYRMRQTLKYDTSIGDRIIDKSLVLIKQVNQFNKMSQQTYVRNLVKVLESNNEILKEKLSDFDSKWESEQIKVESRKKITEYTGLAYVETKISLDILDNVYIKQTSEHITIDYGEVSLYFDMSNDQTFSPFIFSDEFERVPNPTQLLADPYFGISTSVIIEDYANKLIETGLPPSVSKIQQYNSLNSIAYEDLFKNNYSENIEIGFEYLLARSSISDKPLDEFLMIFSSILYTYDDKMNNEEVIKALFNKDIDLIDYMDKAEKHNTQDDYVTQAISFIKQQELFDNYMAEKASRTLIEIINTDVSSISLENSDNAENNLLFSI